ncbi:hypothetical protein HPB48_026556 [Haemaphysalis longicornis]|uniref:SCP domain-containing protein n=1 Tax=Haemaphysalis longicornis TaxID=44386 RepID=A0A9J6HB17_HAELO|nr:hypothetical protein HPB48_026556 [Haemaphysalis longicornis]
MYVNGKQNRVHGQRECCSCEDRTVKNNKWTVTLEEKQDKKPEKGGGDEEEGGGGGGKGRGGDSEEEGGKRRRGNIVVDAWYDEIKMHKWKEFQHETGHFTQVIWKGSKYVGSGIAKLGRKIFVVSNYDPPGNVLGTFAENVLKPQEDDDD